MNRKFVKDLQAWEAGELTLSALSARYPSEEVGRLTGLFSEMRSLSTESAPNPHKGWNMVRSRMAAHIEREPVPLMQRLRPGIQRRLAFGMAAAILVVPPVAFAASNPDAVNSLVGDITVSIFGDEQPAGTGQSASSLPTGGANDDKFTSDGAGSGQNVGEVSGGEGPRKSQVAANGSNGSSVAQSADTNGAAAGAGVADQNGTSGTSGDAGKDNDGAAATPTDAAPGGTASNPGTSTVGAQGSDAQGGTGATSPDTPSAPATPAP